MALDRTKDYMDQCNPGLKHKIESFEAAVCNQCARPECVRSTYYQVATDNRLAKAEGLTTFIDPTDAVDESPLSHYPDELNEDGTYVHRAEVVGTTETSESFDEAALALAQLATPTGVQNEPATLESTTETEPSRPKDPWTAPSGVRMNVYKEFEDSKDDPWSVDFEGGRSIQAESGVTIILSGRKK